MGTRRRCEPGPLLVAAVIDLTLRHEARQCLEERVERIPRFRNPAPRRLCNVVDLSLNPWRTRASAEVLGKLGDQSPSSLTRRAWHQIVEKAEGLPGVQGIAKLLGRFVLEVVRFVDDQMLILRKHAVLRDNVRQEQRMIDDDNVRGLRPRACPVEEAAATTGVLTRPEVADVRVSVQPGPDGALGIGQIKLADVAGVGRRQPDQNLDQGKCLDQTQVAPPP